MEGQRNERSALTVERIGRWTQETLRGRERARERDGTGGSGKGGEIGGRIGWDVQVRQYTKGSPEITIFHSFARSNYFVQLKYRFSPPSPRLSRIRLLQSPSPFPLPFPPARPFLPCYPPYGSIDRAQPCDSSSSHPHPSCYTTAFSPSSLSSLFFPPLHYFLSFSFFASFLLSISFSFAPLSPSVSTYTISAPIFNYWLRKRSRIARKKRETKSLTVSACIRTGACFTVLLWLTSDYTVKKRETEKQREKERERVSWIEGWDGVFPGRNLKQTSSVPSWLSVQMRSCARFAKWARYSLWHAMLQRAQSRVRGT